MTSSKSSAGSSAARALPIGSTAATSAPRTSPCVFADAGHAARIRPRWSARAGSARSSRPSPASAARCWKRRPGIAGLHVRRRDAEQKLRATEANLARLDEVIGDQEARAAAAQAPGAPGRALSRAVGQDPRRRGADDLRALARCRRPPPTRRRRKRLRPRRWSPSGPAAHDRAAAAQQAAAEALATLRAEALAVARPRDRGDAPARDLAFGRARRVERRIAELQDAARRLTEDRGREGALARDAAEALARLAEETRALDTRIAEATARMPHLRRRARRSRARRARCRSRACPGAWRRRRAKPPRPASPKPRWPPRVPGSSARAATRRGSRPSCSALRDAGAAPGRKGARRRCPCPGAAPGRNGALGARPRRRRGAPRDRGAQPCPGRACLRACRAGPARQRGRRARQGHAARRARTGCSTRSKVDAGYERALAAALGDDLEAGLDPAAERYGPAPSALPAIPARLRAPRRSAQHVQAPPGLARRLAQILVAEAR